MVENPFRIFPLDLKPFQPVITDPEPCRVSVQHVIHIYIHKVMKHF